MTGINNGYDRWLTTPPDDPEDVFCETCGHSMEDEDVCPNPYCPDKFEEEKIYGDIVHEMAVELADTQEEVRDIKYKIQFWKNIADSRKAELGECRKLLRVQLEEEEKGDK